MTALYLYTYLINSTNPLTLIDLYLNSVKVWVILNYRKLLLNYSITQLPTHSITQMSDIKKSCTVSIVDLIYYCVVYSIYRHICKIRSVTRAIFHFQKPNVCMRRIQKNCVWSSKFVATNISKQVCWWTAHHRILVVTMGKTSTIDMTSIYIILS